MSQISIDLQVRVESVGQPRCKDMKQWIHQLCCHPDVTAPDQIEVTLCFVEKKEISQLNQEYRNKSGSTNVLSFPFEAPPVYIEEVEHILGDIVICPDIVLEEAYEQNKTPQAHWIHMVLHGVLHLLGYDHQTQEEAEMMEGIESDVLQTLGYEKPFL